MLTISEFSKLCRVSTKTLRHYDQIGLLKPSMVNDDNGYRYYELSQLKTMMAISKLKRYNFSLLEIHALVHSKDLQLLQTSLEEKANQIQRKMDSLNHVLYCLNSDINRLKKGMEWMNHHYEVNTINVKPMSICSLKRRITFKQFPEIIHDVLQVIAKNHYQIIGKGLSIYHDENFNPDDFEVEVGFPVAEQTGEHIRVLEGGLCCMTKHIGPYDDFTPAYTALMEWIQNNNHTIIAPPFEVYVKDASDQVSPDQFETEIYFPIK